MIDEALFIHTVRRDFPDTDSLLWIAFIIAGGHSQKVIRKDKLLQEYSYAQSMLKQ